MLLLSRCLTTDKLQCKSSALPTVLFNSFVKNKHLIPVKHCINKLKGTEQTSRIQLIMEIIFVNFSNAFKI